MKVLHIADVHLTSRLDRSAREAERADRLLTRLSDAVAEGAELVLIAGDLFDTPFESDALTKRVFSALGALSVPVCLIAGNHDCACAGSFYRKAEFPPNVHFLDETHPCFQSEQADVYGFSFYAPYEPRRMLSDFMVKDPNKLNILLFHGDMVSSGGESEYMPYTREELSESGVDYVALGHIHKRTEPQWLGKTAYAYAGIPDGRGFDELGEQGGWMLQLEKGSLTHSFFPMWGRRYLHQTVNLDGLTHTAACVEKIRAELLGSAEDAYKIRLRGEVLFPLSVKTVCEQLSDLYFVKCIDECGQAENWTEGFDGYSLVGLFAQAAEEQIAQAPDEATRQTYALARNLGLAALLEQPLKGVDEE